MSRSFTVRTNHTEQLTIRDLLTSLHELKDIEKYVDIKKASIAKIINDKCTNITDDSLDTSLKDGYSNFLIDGGNIFITFIDTSYDESYKNFYLVESRHLVGIGRDLFVAVASALAAVTDGSVSSCDGAWGDPDERSGSKLWNDYLNCQRELDIKKYS